MTRALLLAAIPFLLGLTSMSPPPAQAPANGSRETIFFAPNTQRFLTIARQGATIASFTVPQGTLLSISMDKDRYTPPDANGRFEAHGKIEVRLQAAAQRDRSVPLAQAMLQAPVVLTGDDVDVTVIR
jgi:hypothetical protein